ncbi:MAG: hypothetical protein ACREAO_10130 [Nitrososphaera sp.]
MARKALPRAPPASKKRKSALERRIREIRKELAALKRFRRTKQRDLFIRRLAGEQRLFERQLSKLPSLSGYSVKGQRPTERPLSKSTALKAANESRAGKMRKYHNYLRQIRDNYPDLTYAQLRRQFSERKRGIKTDVPDVIWRNPSP